jgi:hypothetical protein
MLPEKNHQYSLRMNNAVFWDTAPCRSCENRRFGGACRLNLLDRKNPWARNNVNSLLALIWTSLYYSASQRLILFLASGFFLPWRWRRHALPKHRFSQDLHDATSQKTAFFIVTAVKTSNPSPYSSIQTTASHSTFEPPENVIYSYAKCRPAYPKREK